MQSYLSGLIYFANIIFIEQEKRKIKKQASKKEGNKATYIVKTESKINAMTNDTEKN